MGVATDRVRQETGFNGVSILNDLPHFNFALGFPQDFMHDILEGCAKIVR